jgi:hypothetical protein
MAEQQRTVPDRPAADRYYAEYAEDIRLPAEGGSLKAALQEAINEKAKQS